MDSSNYLTELLQNALDIAKLEEGKIELNKQYESIASVIKFIAKLNQPNANKKEIEIIKQCNTANRVLMDKSRITQVVMNLVSNAVKFTPKKGQIYIKASLDGVDNPIEEVKQAPSHMIFPIDNRRKQNFCFSKSEVLFFIKSFQ